MLKHKYFFLFILIFITPVSNVFCVDYGQDEFKSDLLGPYFHESSTQVFKYGSLMTAALVITRDEFTDQLQIDLAKNDHLGESSQYGDLMGQTIPNFAYIGINYFSEDKRMKRHSTGMFKATFFSGFTTFFLKRLFNQKRPDGGDRNSFPSGHTTTAFAFSSYVADTHSNWKYEAYGLACLVGFSRMNDNVHYLHDVTMGATLGIGFGKYFASIYKEDSSSSTTRFYAIPEKGGGSIVFLNRF